MIGISSIWPKVFFLLVLTVFLIPLVKAWSDVWKKKAAVTGKLMFLSIFILLWGFLIIQLFVREAIFHHDLTGLRHEEVKSIEVGNRTLNEPNDISEVVDSLRGAQWFEVNHGGWADEEPFILHLWSGEKRTYHVAWYMWHEGAVLISMSNFDRSGEGTGWSNGVAFCPRLPAALAASGVDLPHKRADREKSQKVESENAAPGRWPARMAPIAIFSFFTLGALGVFRRLVKRTDLAIDTRRIPNAQVNLVTTIGGLALVSVIAAGCGLRVVYALFDWPDPTNMGTIMGVALLLLVGGTCLLLQRHRKG